MSDEDVSTTILQTTQPRQVVVVVHGIRDRAEWENDVESILTKHDVSVVCMKYGRFDPLMFLFPLIPPIIAWLRNEQSEIEQVKLTIRNAMDANPGAEVSIVAHSFGTYLMSRILADDTHLRYFRIVFCGSVVKQSYRWDQVRWRIGDPHQPDKRRYIVNDCGSGDKWPAVAEMASLTRYGAAGTDGFNGGYITNRYHKGNHSVFLSPTFIEEYWKPFIHDGLILPGEGKQGADLPRWFNGLRIFTSKTMLCLILVAALWFAYVRYTQPVPVAPVILEMDETLQSLIVEDYQAMQDAYVKSPDAGSASLADFRKQHGGKVRNWTVEIVSSMDGSSPILMVKLPEDKSTPPNVWNCYFSPEDFKKVAGIPNGRVIVITGMMSKKVDNGFRNLQNCKFVKQIE